MALDEESALPLLHTSCILVLVAVRDVVHQLCRDCHRQVHHKCSEGSEWVVAVAYFALRAAVDGMF